MTPSSVVARFPVGLEPGAASGEQLDALLARRPSGTVTRVGAFGFAYGREPDVFAAVATGAALGTGILLTEFTVYAPHFTIVGRVLAVLAFLTALLLFARFLRNAWTRVEIDAKDGALVQRTTLLGRTRAEARVDAEAIVAVLVLAAEGQPRRVVLAGPRHEQLGDVYRLRALDPESLAPWLAELTALVAARASAR